MKLNNFLLVLLLILCSALLFVFFQNGSNDNGDKKYYETSAKYYRIFSLYIPDELTFAGEKVPLEKYYVRERLERELYAVAFWHSRTNLILKRSSRYFPVFKPIFDTHSIPYDFFFLAMAESELSQPVSPAGAAGMWQFLKATAIQYGLEVNDEVDERYHVEKSTHAACKYLREAYLKFNSWTLAAASYNMGAARIPQLMKEQQTDSYFDLVLPEETSRYVYRILAFKIIWENPRQYGFFLRNKDLYYPIPVNTLTVDSAITDLASFAAQQNVPFLVLKEHNQWLRKNALKNIAKKQYLIEIPVSVNYNDIMKDIADPDVLMNDTIVFR